MCEATFVPLRPQGCLCAGQEVGDRRYAFQSTTGACRSNDCGYRGEGRGCSGIVVPGVQPPTASDTGRDFEDEQLTQLLGVLRSGWPKSRNALRLVAQPLWDNRQLFTEIEGLLLRGTQMVILRSMRPEILQRATMTTGRG